LEGILFSYRTVPRDESFNAMYEVRSILEKIKNEYPALKNLTPTMNPGGHRGLIFVDLRDIIKGLSEEVISQLKKTFIDIYGELKEAQELESVLKMRIFDIITEASLEKVVEGVLKIKDKIQGRWRITLKTRHVSISREELIKKAAEPINYPVDLKNPEYILLIEFFGNLVGLSVIKNK